MESLYYGHPQDHMNLSVLIRTTGSVLTREVHADP